MDFSHVHLVQMVITLLLPAPHQIHIKLVTNVLMMELMLSLTVRFAAKVQVYVHNVMQDIIWDGQLLQVLINVGHAHQDAFLVQVLMNVIYVHKQLLFGFQIAMPQQHKDQETLIHLIQQ